MISWMLILYSLGFAQVPAKGSNISSGSAGKSKIYSHQQIQENNKTAHKYIQSYETFKSGQAKQLVEAAQATVQIIPKCQVAIDGDGYYIGHEKSLGFCEGHPLSEHGIPSPYKSSDDEPKTLAKTSKEDRKPCASRPCSGALIGSSQTVGTAGHCMQGLSSKEFCEQFVFVFGRSGDQTKFSKDEVVGCDDGVALDTGGTSPDFNFHADNLSQDHAVLRLKKPVPASVARPLTVRNSPPSKSEKLFAVGHPYGHPRMVSPLTTSFVKKGDGYNYIHSEGYVYGGNSGGPLLDGKGQVVGIMVATDDKEFGTPQKREPLVQDEKTKKMCRTQIATSTIEIEAVGFDSKIQSVLDRQISQLPTAPPEGSARDAHR